MMDGGVQERPCPVPRHLPGLEVEIWLNGALRGADSAAESISETRPQRAGAAERHLQFSVVYRVKGPDRA